MNSSNKIIMKSKRRHKSNKLSMKHSKGSQSDLQKFVQREIEEGNVLLDDENQTSHKSRKHLRKKKRHKDNELKIQDEPEVPKNTSSDFFDSSTNKTVQNECNDSLIVERKNAFEVMMDSRHKVIGRNSPGKDVEVNIIDDDSTNENKVKLAVRKSLLEKWADAKGGIKRKLDDDQKQLYINEKLEVRAKRLKNMLSISSSEKRKSSNRSSKKQKTVKIIISDSEKSSSDEALNTKPIHSLEELDDNVTETENNVIKIKMFSANIFKKRERKEESENLALKNGKVKKHKRKHNKSIMEISNREVHKNDVTGIINTVVSDNDDENVNVRRSSRLSTKKHNDSDLRSFVNSDSEDIDVSYDLNDKQSNNSKSKKLVNVKVAPVFLKVTVKPKLDPATIEARKQFLMSGIPESLKKITEKQQVLNDLEYDVFPTISHVQQRTETEHVIDYWSLPLVNLRYRKNELYSPNLKEVSLRFLLNYTEEEHKQSLVMTAINKKQLKPSLKEIKLKNQEYPVFRTFRFLQEKICKDSSFEKAKIKENRKQKLLELEDMWIEKFKATTSEEILGNHASIVEFKKWLLLWQEYSRRMKFDKEKHSPSSSEFDSSDDENLTNITTPSNAVVLIGPNGSGKTMTIYAICNELDINILELSASDKRTGKCLLQKLQEATQSHQMRKNNLCSINEIEKTESEQDKKQKMCLLIVDDVDVIFEQDEGFLSALSQLLMTTKRPIVLVTTDENCNHIQKFITQYPVIKFSPLSGKILSVWMQILCLIEGVKVGEDLLGKLLEQNKGDARRTLLQLQFWLQNDGKKSLRSIKKNDVTEGHLDNEITHSNYKQVFSNNIVVLENIWWNLPSLLNIPSISHNITNCNDQTNKTVEDIDKLKTCASVFDTFAMSDFISTKLKLFSNKEPCPKSSLQTVKDSMELAENMDAYDSSNEIIFDWIYYSLTKHLNADNMELLLTHSTSDETRWRSKQYSCEAKFLELVPLSYRVDKKAFSLDYFPALRTVARLERQRAATNNKRGNRFYNYLSTLGFNCKNARYQTACDILHSDGGYQNT